MPSFRFFFTRYRKLLLSFFMPLVFISFVMQCSEARVSSDGHLTLFEHLIMLVDPDDFEDEETFEAYLSGLIEQFPLDLNQASGDELLLIPDIREQTVREIKKYRKNRPFTTVNELLEVPGIGNITLQRLAPWVTVNYKRSFGASYFRGLSFEQLFRYQQVFPATSGYKKTEENPPHYAGSPARIYHRHRATGEHLSAHLTQVKLPGEPFKGPYRFDFTSAHIGFRNIGPFSRVIIGDYAARFGQGLVLWSAPSFGKGGVSHRAPYRRGQGITPYQSTGQIRFFRGAAVETTLPFFPFRFNSENQLKISAFASFRKRSAMEVSGDTIRPPTVNPYHRTASEQARRNNTLEKVFGGHLKWEHPKGNIGITYAVHELDRPVMPLSSSPPFRGSDTKTIGLDFTYDSGNMRAFGEIALRLTDVFSHKIKEDNISLLNKEPGHNTFYDHTAWISGIMGSFTSALDWVLALRSYQSGYWSEYGSGFGEGSGVPVNQKGGYAGFRLRPHSGIGFEAFIDRFYFPQPRRGFTQPSEGWEYQSQLRYRNKENRNYVFRIRYKEQMREKERQDDYTRSIRITKREYRLSGRVQFNWHLSSQLFLRMQYDQMQSGVKRGSYQNGMALSQTLRWQIREKVRMDMNISLFETDDFASRLYLFEYDVTYAMRSVMAYGTGRRSYLVIRYQPNKWLLAETKIGQVHYYDRPSIGSGHNLTSGNRQTHVGFQVRFQY